MISIIRKALGTQQNQGTSILNLNLSAAATRETQNTCQTVQREKATVTLATHMYINGTCSDNWVPVKQQQSR